ncbi:hypothetical protein D3C84_1171690 [compost metagenome]
MAGDDANAVNRHRSEPIDDAIGHVSRNVYRRAGGSETGAQQDNAGNDIVDIVATGGNRAAEDISKQKH